MAATIPPATSLNDPNLLFTEDIIADPSEAPQIFIDPLTPKLRIYARGKGPGNPNIVTERTGAYILSWENPDPSVCKERSAHGRRRK